MCSPNTTDHAFSRRLAIIAFSAVVILFVGLIYSAAAARADDDDDDVPQQPQPQAVQNQFVLTPETLDQWIFGGVTIRDNNNSNARHLELRCQALLEMRIDAVDRICNLTDAQKSKLRLAASGDMKKFCDAYEQLSSKYINTKRDPNDVNQIYAAIQPLPHSGNPESSATNPSSKKSFPLPSSQSKFLLSRKKKPRDSKPVTRRKSNSPSRHSTTRSPSPTNSATTWNSCF